MQNRIPSRFMESITIEIKIKIIEIFTYKSTKTSVAKVSSKGKIVAVAPGKCTIAVKTK